MSSFFDNSKNRNLYSAYHYCLNQVQGRCKEAEKYIIQSPYCAYLYARDVIKDRWLEAESTIMQSPYSAYHYSRYVIKGRWLEAESVILNSEWKTHYEDFINVLRIEHEKFFENPYNQNAASAYHYCLNQVQGRCKEAEKYIIEKPYYVYLYARDIIKDRWPEAEKYIVNSPLSTYNYIKEVIGKPFSELEPGILKDPLYCYLYAENVVKGKWPMGENAIYKHDVYKELYEDFIQKLKQKVTCDIKVSPTNIQIGGQPINPKDEIGSKKVSFSCVPSNVISEIALGLTEGSRKYGKHNYRTINVRTSVYYDACMRHLMQYWEGEDIDQDSQLNHITKALSCLTVLRDAMMNDKCIDDRPPKVDSNWVNEANKKSSEIIKKYPNCKPPYCEKNFEDL